MFPCIVLNNSFMFILIFLNFSAKSIINYNIFLRYICTLIYYFILICIVSSCLFSGINVINSNFVYLLHILTFNLGIDCKYNCIIY